MRFLKVGCHNELTLTKDSAKPPAPYAILSHTWGADDDEVTFDDLKKSLGIKKAGYAKLRFCASQARTDGLEYIWVDTCCIDKTNHVELSEAITSMFRWYRDAAKCYVFLSDVSLGHNIQCPTQQTWEMAFRTSRWFTRGWTLQELLAPSSVEFFSLEGRLLGSKQMLEGLIHEITSVPVSALQGTPLSTFSVDERLRWTRGRNTQKVEDKAYCLLGIFNIFMSLIYGEGDNAFKRLKEEIGITVDQIDAAIRETYSGRRLAVERLSDKGQLLSKFSLAARLKVETPLDSNQVSLKTLFDLRNRNNGSKFRPNRVLIWGGAGMGKTTLCKKMVHDFYYDGLWSDLYDRVVWLPLRKLKVMEHETHDVVKLIQKEFVLNGSEKNLVERLQKVVIYDERTLFILDGLDEVSYTLDLESSTGNILDYLLARPNVIITSRPHSTSILDHRPPDLELETIGFFPQQVEEYIQRATKLIDTSNKIALEIKSFLENRPLVQSLARIPVQLDAICYAWNTKHFPKNNVTMTTLYQAIVQRLWGKDVVRLRKKFNGQPVTKQQTEDLPNVEIFVGAETEFLQELGFQGLCTDVIEFEITDIKREFFAAQYFVRHWTPSTVLSLWGGPRGGLSARKTQLINPEEFLSTEKYVGRYDIFWRFVVGLLHTEADHSHLHRFFKVLEEEPFDLIGLTHQRLTIHCLNEIGPDNGEFQCRVREREEHYIQWILCESRLKKSASRTSLIWEAECSDYILEILLKNGETRSEVMEMLCRRPSVSSNILDVLLHILNRNADTAIRRAAIQVLGQQCNQTREKKFLMFWHRVQGLSTPDRLEVAEALGVSKKLLQPAVEALIALLRDPDWSVRSQAASALGGQTSLPSSAVEALIALLRDPDRSVQAETASALGGQTSLSSSAVEALIPLLRDPKEWIRSTTADFLDSREELYYSILSLDSLALQGLLQAWLSRGSVTCSIWDRSFCIDINGKQWRVPLQNGQQAPFKCEASASAQDAKR